MSLIEISSDPIQSTFDHEHPWPSNNFSGVSLNIRCTLPDRTLIGLGLVVRTGTKIVPIRQVKSMDLPLFRTFPELFDKHVARLPLQYRTIHYINRSHLLHRSAKYFYLGSLYYVFNIFMLIECYVSK